jgi:flavin-dependent dehydrogenase
VQADLIICGGGPAGLAAAIHAARNGLHPIVLDARPLPLDKACGEGVMPAGVAELQEMGVSIGEASHTAFRGIRYVDESLVAEGHFHLGVGWGVRRTTLIAALVARADQLGIALRYGCAMKRWRSTGSGNVQVDTDDDVLDGPLLIGADGLHSRIRREAGLAYRWHGARRLGIRRHFGVAPWSHCVEVHLAGDVEAYVTPTGSREVGVALMWNGDARRFDELMAELPSLRDRLADAVVTSSVRGAGPFRQGVRRRHAPGVALVGDAAGYLDPLTGEGITLGFLSARALVETIARGAPLEHYERAYRRLSSNYYRMTALLLAIAPHRRLRRRVIGALARSPEIFDHFLAVNDGATSLHALGWRGLARLLQGLALAPPVTAGPRHPAAQVTPPMRSSST